MCQGAIVSIVRFGKKRVVLSGIGSHSTLIADNKKLLEKRGWKEDAPNQSVVSYESDFTQNKWGKFTHEAGDPKKGDEKIVKAEFKRVSGSASALIKHIQRIGRIDDALVKLLTAPAWEAYSEATATALESLQRGNGSGIGSLQRGNGYGIGSLQRGNGYGIGSLQRGNGYGMESLQRGNGSGMESLQRGNGSGMESLQRGNGYGMESLQRGNGYGIGSLQRGNGYGIGSLQRGNGYGIHKNFPQSQKQDN